jgi:hypothetical protein
MVFECAIAVLCGKGVWIVIQPSEDTASFFAIVFYQFAMTAEAANLILCWRCLSPVVGSENCDFAGSSEVGACSARTDKRRKTEKEQSVDELVHAGSSPAGTVADKSGQSRCDVCLFICAGVLG